MAKRQKGPDLSYICEGLRGLAVPIADLVSDPANANKHGKKSLAAIKGSLVQFGQRTPLVVQQTGMIVRKGNGTLAAAIELGWTHVAAVVVNDDNITAIGYAIADNRTAELSEWDDDALRKLYPEIAVGDADLQQMFTDLSEELKLFEVTDDEEPEGDDPADDESPPDVPAQFRVLVTVADSDTQAQLLQRLAAEGYECTAFSD